MASAEVGTSLAIWKRVAVLARVGLLARHVQKGQGTERSRAIRRRRGRHVSHASACDDVEALHAAPRPSPRTKEVRPSRGGRGRLRISSTRELKQGKSVGRRDYDGLHR